MKNAGTFKAFRLEDLREVPDTKKDLDMPLILTH